MNLILYMLYILHISLPQPNLNIDLDGKSFDGIVCCNKKLGLFLTKSIWVSSSGVAPHA